MGLGQQSAIDRGKRVWQTAINVCLLSLAPGTVIHELSHALACRLLGIDVEHIVWTQWPADFTRDRFGGGYVTHKPVSSVWKKAVVSCAPLLINTVGAFACFFFVRTIYLIPHTGSGARPLWYYFGHLRTVSAELQVAVCLAAWLGFALAVYGFPSASDLQSVGRAIDGVIGQVDDSKRLQYSLWYLRRELSTLYTFTVAGVGLFGLTTAVELVRTEYWLYLIVGLSTAGASVWWRQSPRLPTRHVDTYNRCRALARQQRNGTGLTDDEIDFLVTTVSDGGELLRLTATEALDELGRADPERLAKWDGELLTAAKQIQTVSVRQNLFRVLGHVVEYSADTERVAQIGVTVLTTGPDELTDDVIPILGQVAEQEPETVSAGVEALVDRLPDAPPLTRQNILLTLGRVVAGSADHTTEPSTDTRDRYDELQGSRTSVHSQVRDGIPQAHRQIVDVLFGRLDDIPSVRSTALGCLGEIGGAYPNVSPPLIALFLETIDTEPRESQIGAANGLAEIATRTSEPFVPAIDPILALLELETDRIRIRASFVLSTLSSTDAATVATHVEHLVSNLDDPVTAVRVNLLSTVSSIAETYPEAVEPYISRVQPLLTDSSEDVVVNATALVLSLAESAPELAIRMIDQLHCHLSAEDARVRENTTEVCAELAPDSPGRIVSWRTDLATRLTDTNAETRVAAARTMAVLADEYPIVITLHTDRLFECLDTTDEELRTQCLQAISALADLDNE